MKFSVLMFFPIRFATDTVTKDTQAAISKEEPTSVPKSSKGTKARDVSNFFKMSILFDVCLHIFRSAVLYCERMNLGRIAQLSIAQYTNMRTTMH